MGTLAEPKTIGNVFTVIVGISAILLAWFGYSAVRGWQGTSLALTNRRTEEAAMLLVSALTKDMQAVHRSILASSDSTTAIVTRPLDALDPIATAFARYPYAEWFFSAKDYSTQQVLFIRRDRPPAWLPAPAGPDRFPVVVIDNPPIRAVLAKHIARDAKEKRRYSVFETTFAGRPYQVVNRLLYTKTRHRDTVAVVGFAVDMTWARERYFPELTEQIGRLWPSTAGVGLTIVDDAGQPVSATLAPGGDNEVRRRFSAAFFDSVLLTPNAPKDVPMRQWTVRAMTLNDPPLAAAQSGGSRMLLLGALSVIALFVGVGLTVRASASSTRLAELRADFVSSVTHELKTPIATIRAAGETLLAGRITDVPTQKDYAGMVVQEAKRLGQLIDNLLAFSRVTDTHTVLLREPIHVDELVADTLRLFDLQLSRAGFETVISFPAPCPAVWGDRAALQLTMANLLDNAIRYTRDDRRIEIKGTVVSDRVVVEISDRGIGIGPADIPHITKKFFRARNAGQGGTGLGLAIADRIIAEHGGTIGVCSTLGKGTTIVVTLPMAPDDSLQADIA